MLIVIFWWLWVKPKSTENIDNTDNALNISDILYKKNNNEIKNNNIINNYNGSINDKINYINSTLKTYKINPPFNVISGHSELTPDENNNAPYGIPFNRTNISSPANPPYKELNNTTIDYDEKNIYQGLGRNDPYRPINGIMNRANMIDPYIRDELDKEERKEWWGNGEV